ncbi:hypothetical protein ACFL1H_06790, partial [Nanoarchaeota archaeon]
MKKLIAPLLGFGLVPVVACADEIKQAEKDLFNTISSNENVNVQKKILGPTTYTVDRQVKVSDQDLFAKVSYLDKGRKGPSKGDEINLDYKYFLHDEDGQITGFCHDVEKIILGQDEFDRSFQKCGIYFSYGGESGWEKEVCKVDMNTLPGVAKTLNETFDKIKTEEELGYKLDLLFLNMIKSKNTVDNDGSMEYVFRNGVEDSSEEEISFGSES